MHTVGRECDFDNKEKISVVTKMQVFVTGLHLDDDGYGSLIMTAQCADKLKCAWMHDCVMKSEFSSQFVSNWYPPYYVLFMNSKGCVISALECYGDCFRFVEAKKTGWSYYVGPVIPVQGNRKAWREINGFKKTVWQMTNSRFRQANRLRHFGR